MISAEYVKQNRQLHEESEEYGSQSMRWAKQVVALCASVGTKNVLDYGCGKGGLVKALRGADFDVQGYDPCVEEFSARPNPAAVVVCTDVLEHIEPEHIDAVLDDIQSLALHAVYFIVSTRPAKKILPDGRNAHLSLRHSNEWLKDLMKRFRLVSFNDVKHGFVAVMLK
ncbi:MAG: methyltransferase domain-containing protein [Gallionella sp.]